MLEVDHHRINAIYLELKKLSSDDFPNSAAAMMRVFLKACANKQSILGPTYKTLHEFIHNYHHAPIPNGATDIVGQSTVVLPKAMAITTGHSDDLSPTMNFLSPLRYPGGKRKLANFIRLLFYQNDLLDGEYAELYAGGASVALSLLYGEFVSRIHINDIDPAVAAFWQVALESTEELTKRIRDAAVTMAEWERQRSVQESKGPDPVDLAFSTFFLNRTNRSGIIKGGVIGGKAQTGRRALDARFNKTDLIGRIEKVARHRARITTHQLDGADFICNVLPSLPPRALVYLDPPYYVKGGDLYEHYYQHEDHERIATLVGTIKQPWVVSYDYVPAIERMYEGYRRRLYGIHYSAQARYKDTEIMVFSPQLRIPEVADPSKVRPSDISSAATP